MKQMNNELTIIITSHPVPSHPNIYMLKRVLNSYKLIKYGNSTVYDSCPIILAHDYFETPKYITYLENIKKYIKDLKKNNITIIKRDTHGHLSGNIRNAMKLVKTEFIIVAQQDLEFVRSFDIGTIIQDMKEKSFLKFIKFNKRKNISYCSDKGKLFGQQISTKRNNYTRTPGWTDQNHICKTTYYTEMILKEVPDGTFMEDIIHCHDASLNHQTKYGTYIYGKLNENQYIKDLIGRRYIES